MAAVEAITHRAVLAQEAVEALLAGGVQVKTPVYVDATFGGGGHSGLILQNLSPQGRLLAIDCDETAAANAADWQQPNFIFARRNYSELSEILADYQIDGVCGVLFDLGVSSMQLEEGARGFSFNLDAPLDMRLDRRSGTSAAQWLQDSDEKEMVRVLKTFGQEPEARRIAWRLSSQRDQIKTTRQLAQAVCQAKQRPSPPHRHPATLTFQAIRMAVNSELEHLQKGLAAARRALVQGGRLVVIAFHSLEDRIVKRLVPLNALPDIGRIGVSDLRAEGKMRRPSAAEVDANPRARSACLRVFTKIGGHVA